MLWLSADLINNLVGGKTFSVVATRALIFLVAIALMNLLSSWLDSMRGKRMDLFDYKVSKLASVKLMNLSYFQLQDPAMREKYEQAQMASTYQGGFGALIDNGFNAILKGVISFVIGIVFLVKLNGAKATEVNTLSKWSNSVIFTIVLLALIAVPILINIWVAKKQALIAKKGFDDNLRLNTKVEYLINTVIEYKNGPVFRLYKAGELLIHQYKNFQAEAIQIYFKQNNDEMTYDAIGGLIAAFFSMGIYLLVVIKSYYGAIAIGSVLLYAGYFIQMTGALNVLFSVFAGLNTLVSVLSYYAEFLQIKPDTMGTLPVEKRDDNEYEIKFNDVSFKYPGDDKYILRHLNLSLKVGEKLALVGRNGSGKSTIVKLMARLYPVTEGSITLNGIDVNKYNVDEYRSLLAVVFQDFKLFPFSMAENVAGSMTVDEKRVEEALYIAGIHDRVAEMPKGIHTILYKALDEAGIEVSGGEAQKIAIARAWYRDAPFVILDEPTSELDPLSEFEVYRRFDELVSDKTSIYISHRMSSTRFANRIVVLADGEVIQSGTHDELMARGGLYADLFNAQADYYREELNEDEVKALLD